MPSYLKETPDLITRHPPPQRELCKSTFPTRPYTTQALSNLFILNYDDTLVLFVLNMHERGGGQERTSRGSLGIGEPPTSLFKAKEL